MLKAGSIGMLGEVWHYYTVGTGTQPPALLHGTCLLVLQLDTTVILCSRLEH